MQAIYEKLKSATFIPNNSFYYSDKCKVLTNKAHTCTRLTYIDKCDRCKHEKRKIMFIKFEKEHNLTIFECGFILALYLFEKKVSDYHRYLDCIAGKKFVNNIKKIEVLK